MKNILWLQPNKTLAETIFPQEFTGDSNTEASRMIAENLVPADWQLIIVDTQWSADKRWKHETYRWSGTEVIVDYTTAVEETKNRLRSERIPLLAALDIQFQRNLETNSDNSAVILEKQRLRDITIIDPNLTLDELYNLHC